MEWKISLSHHSCPWSHNGGVPVSRGDAPCKCVGDWGKTQDSTKSSSASLEACDRGRVARGSSSCWSQSGITSSSSSGTMLSLVRDSGRRLVWDTGTRLSSSGVIASHPGRGLVWDTGTRLSLVRGVIGSHSGRVLDWGTGTMLSLVRDSPEAEGTATGRVPRWWIGGPTGKTVGWWK